MPSPYKFEDPSDKSYSAQLQECSERHKFVLEQRLITRPENGRDVHKFYFIIDGIPYTQHTATSTSTVKEAKNEAAGFIINSGIL
ncbi:hypothetical protein RSOLAG1IB_08955 [Rhizoctonia solani AG-1 IB]|nr:hypothetical protein RSOLAG1IB_08955 [Rhizoctonia solani AG-1 IB]